MNRFRPFAYETCAGIDINLEEAWKISTGSQEVVVAVLDDGFDYRRPDLLPNLWVNRGETGRDPHGLDRAANGVDDDHDGYVDDLHGYDFAGHQPDPGEFVWCADRRGDGRIVRYGHGTSLLGIIGAKPVRDSEFAGINHEVSLMLLKTSDGQCVGYRRPYTEGEAIRYAADHGARIISWSGWLADDHTARDEADLVQAIEYARGKGILIVMAAGNDALDMDAAASRGKLPFPLARDFDNVVYVANVDACGNLARDQERETGSNYGLRVFIAAPGTNVLTTDPESYAFHTGTSVAQPMVAGVAALILSVRPDLRYLEIKDVLCRSAKPLPGLAGKVRCGGLLDAGRALRSALDHPRIP